MIERSTNGDFNTTHGVCANEPSFLYKNIKLFIYFSREVTQQKYLNTQNATCATRCKISHYVAVLNLICYFSVSVIPHTRTFKDTRTCGRMNSRLIPKAYLLLRYNGLYRTRVYNTTTTLFRPDYVISVSQSVRIYKTRSLHFSDKYL